MSFGSSCMQHLQQQQQHRWCRDQGIEKHSSPSSTESKATFALDLASKLVLDTHHHHHHRPLKTLFETTPTANLSGVAAADQRRLSTSDSTDRRRRRLENRVDDDAATTAVATAANRCGEKTQNNKILKRKKISERNANLLFSLSLLLLILSSTLLSLFFRKFGSRQKNCFRCVFFSFLLPAFLSAFPLPISTPISPPPPGNVPPSGGPSPPTQRRNDISLSSVKAYLLKYGYVTTDTISNMGGGSDDSIDLGANPTVPTDRRRSRGWEAFTAGLTAFQRLANVPETGLLDNATITALQRPRCGIKDVDANVEFPLPLGANQRTRGRGRGRGPGGGGGGGRGRRQNEGETEWQSMAARYQLQGSKWNKDRVTWKISSTSQDLARTTQENIFSRAFQLWAKYTSLTFQKVCASCPCDIEVKFAKWGHGDNDAFDGPSGVLAHAFYPRYGGDAHFDDDEFWTDRSNRGTNLFQVAVHEIGHSLGLKHSQQTTAIMAPFYKAFDPNFDLQADDIQGIQSLYGVRTAPTLLPPFNPDSSAQGGGAPGGGTGGAGGSGDSGIYYPVRPPSPWWWYSYYYGYRPYSGNPGGGTATSLRPQSQMGFPFNSFNGHLQLPMPYGTGYGGYGYGRRKKK